MDSDMQNLSDKITDDVKNSGFYKKYRKSIEAVKSDKVLFEQINDFKKRHFEYQSRIFDGAEPCHEEETAVSRLYFKLMMNEDARYYMEYEELFLELVNNICRDFSGEV